MIYLDNSATTKIDAEVLDAMLPWLQEEFGNASATYSLGRKARVAIESAREEIAHAMNAHPAELIFTSGGTESNNAILKSCCTNSALVQRVAYSAVEHHAIIHPAEELQRFGYATQVLSVDEHGIVSLEEVAQCNQADTLLSVMHGNNETGIISPIESIRALVPDAYVHTDAVQTFGKIPFDVAALGVDFASISAHKIHGPKGVGAMFIRKGIDFKSHQQGGGQERNRRAGTESVALIVGFQVAVRKAIQEMEQRALHTSSLLKLLRTKLIESVPSIRFNTPVQGALPTICNISFLDAQVIDGEAVLQMMDMNGVAVSNGSACVSGTSQPSHVLKAMHRSDAEAKAAVRFSLSKNTTLQEIERAVAVLAEVVSMQRG